MDVLLLSLQQLFASAVIVCAIALTVWLVHDVVAHKPKHRKKSFKE